MDMETDMGGATDEDDNGKNQGADLTGDNEADEVIMGTQQETNDEGERVRVSVSHSGLTNSLRALDRMKTNIRTWVQLNNGGPRKKIEKTLWDITNQLQTKPIITKPTKIITKLSAGQKRPGEV